MTRKFNPETDRQILDDVCKVTLTPSLYHVHGAFLKYGIEWPILNPMFKRRSAYAELVEREIGLAWVRRGWLKAA